jgi:acetyltransferase-like isoleucine patch superfamily enzyme
MTTETHTAPPRISSFRNFVSENGLFLTFQKICGFPLYRTRNYFLGRRLGSRGLRVGKNPKLIGLSHIRLGENFSAGNSLWLEAVTHFAGRAYHPAIDIGRNCNVSDNVHIGCTNQITIADNFLCGSRVIISDHAHGLYSGAEQSPPGQPPMQRQLTSDRAVIIGRNVWIGDGTAILGGAHIGDGAIIGANSVVNGLIPSHTMAAGSPARPIRHWDDATGQWIRLQSD